MKGNTEADSSVAHPVQHQSPAQKFVDCDSVLTSRRCGDADDQGTKSSRTRSAHSVSATYVRLQFVLRCRAVHVTSMPRRYYTRVSGLSIPCMHLQERRSPPVHEKRRHLCILCSKAVVYNTAQQQLGSPQKDQVLIISTAERSVNRGGR